ncbi:MAG: hypothetical protein JO020_09820 [Chloroflexi bacterium]|nr:hypothetical protein [Chloroflexota bacterium]
MFSSRSQTSSKSRPLLPRLLTLRKNFTAEEVRMRLRLDSACDTRTAAVHAAASLSGVWASLLTDRVAFDLGRSANRLPTVVFWYRQGLSPHEIGRRLSPFGTCWDAERALTAAAELIAQALNRGDVAELVA